MAGITQDEIEQARKDYITGKRKTSVTTADRSETYQAIDPKYLDNQEAQIISAGRPRIFRTRFCKGL